MVSGQVTMSGTGGVVGLREGFGVGKGLFVCELCLPRLGRMRKRSLLILPESNNLGFATWVDTKVLTSRPHGCLRNQEINYFLETMYRLGTNLY